MSSSSSSPASTEEREQLTCHTRACALQSCLQKNTYDAARCDKLVDDLYRCCARFYQANPDYKTQPDACPKPAETSRKMKQRGLGVEM